LVSLPSPPCARADRQHVAFKLDADVLLLHTRQFGLEDELLVGFGDIRGRLPLELALDRPRQWPAPRVEEALEVVVHIAKWNE
jgi:hypothetical protein